MNFPKEFEDSGELNVLRGVTDDLTSVYIPGANGVPDNSARDFAEKIWQELPKAIDRAVQLFEDVVKFGKGWDLEGVGIASLENAEMAYKVELYFSNDEDPYGLWKAMLYPQNGESVLLEISRRQV